MSHEPPGWEEYQRFRPQFWLAMDPRLYTMEWLDGMVWAGIYRVFANEQAAIIAEIKVYPAGSHRVEGVIAAGDLAEIRKLIPQAEEWGRSLGSIGSKIDSRLGWAKVLKEDGYELHQVAICKEF